MLRALKTKQKIFNGFHYLHSTKLNYKGVSFKLVLARPEEFSIKKRVKSKFEKRKQFRYFLEMNLITVIIAR
jgi:hypothetical protein